MTKRTHQQHNKPWLAENTSIGILLLRLFLGSRLLYGVIDNIFSWERMLEFSGFLAQYQFPWPTVSAITSVYVQGISAILLLIGYQTRLAAVALCINFLVALFMVHIPAGDSIEGMTPALAMLFAALTLFFTGAQKISVDAYIDRTSHYESS